MIQEINKWLTINSNSDWEHEYGIRILSTDIPGWSIEIDLNETCLSEASYSYSETSNNSHLEIIIDNKKFKGYCSLGNFNKCLSHFFNEVICKLSDKEFEYEIFVSFEYKNLLFYSPVYCRITKNLKLEVVRIFIFVCTCSFDEIL